MVPEHLAFQLFSVQEEKKVTEQRNMQVEFLAVLMAILKWHEDVGGQLLLILTDSIATPNNCRAGTDADQQSRDLVSTILFWRVFIVSMSDWDLVGTRTADQLQKRKRLQNWIPR